MAMQQKQLEDIFDFYGLSEVYRRNFEDAERHWLFKDVEVTILEDFFNSHDCEDLECCTLEEFCFSFMNFQSIHAQIPHVYYY
ncbi:hypothetical protein [Priestia megaterium]|jgi:hypothetical protein|uniref:hypothetical protein n=3 Tax=Priestia megaterium TaxID=1404 RepID=UPI001868129F|nr:hypothetical protein [Priestia megaterium]MBE2975256.1 hypothetical protein [Priestia megaterium]MCY9021684.1 hypothetical protein [Priestia megaterium]